MKSITFIAFAIASVLAHPAIAQVTVEQPWVRATAPGQTVAGAYMRIKSIKACALVGVRTPISKAAEIHEMTMDNGVMKMRAVPRIALPAGKTIDLKPGGYHLMFMNIAQPLRKGDTVPITLVIEGHDKKRRKVEIKAEVRDLAVAEDSHRQMMGAPSDFETTRTAYTGDHQFLVKLLSVPSPIPFEQYFTLTFVVFDGHDPQKKLSDVDLKVSAGMRHEMKQGFAHGMASAPTISAKDGVFAVSGMYFSMMGPWTLEVTVKQGGKQGVAYFQLPCCRQ